MLSILKKVNIKYNLKIKINYKKVFIKISFLISFNKNLKEIYKTINNFRYLFFYKIISNKNYYINNTAYN